MDNIPPYFKEYLEQKFNELHKKIDSVFKEHDAEIIEIKTDVIDVKKDVKWLNQKVWMAIGALTIISVVGGIFVGYFKQLNKAQVTEAVKESIDPTKQQVVNIGKQVDTIVDTLRDYDIRVTNY